MKCDALLTEEAAATKLCFNMTYLVNPHQVAEGMAAEYANCRCVASACMAWRWYDNYYAEESCFDCSLNVNDKCRRRGYCGLAGDIRSRKI